MYLFIVFESNFIGAILILAGDRALFMICKRIDFGQDKFAIDVFVLEPMGVLDTFVEEEVSRSNPDPSRGEVGERGARSRGLGYRGRRSSL